MKYRLLGQQKWLDAKKQILENRGIKDIDRYLNLDESCINEPELLGQRQLYMAAFELIKNIKNKKETIIVVDCDADGYTSSALLINFLHDLFPAYVENHITWLLHEGKAHGLCEFIERIVEKSPGLVIVPDAGSNDYTEHQILSNHGIKCIVLDHHEADHVSPNAIIINNQLSDYPNKELSGVGVVWQFCRYMSHYIYNDVNKYLDLVMLGLTADMMSLRSYETKFLIEEGLKNLRNPFIKGMAEKNAFSLGADITSFGVAFYIAPFVNAIVRSGTSAEKELVFSSMLDFKGNESIDSTKRGHALGEKQLLYEQALRVATNVKSRQTKAQDSGMKLLEKRIEENKMLDHKVLLFQLDPGEIDPSIRGLVANKLMAKYSKPCCVLTKDEQGISGSARGCDRTGVNEFKDICEQTGLVDYAVGHQGAFGLSIAKDNIQNFIEKTDSILQDVNDESVYDVDFIYQASKVSSRDIYDIADCSHFWGKDMPQSLIAIENVRVKKNNIILMGVEKNKPTIKITLECGLQTIALIKFNATLEEFNQLASDEGIVTINIVGKCNKNVWNGTVSPQILIQDYEIKNKVDFYF